MSAVPFGYSIDIWPQMVRPRIKKLPKPVLAGSRWLTWCCGFNDVTPTLFSSFEEARNYVAYY